MKTKVDDFLIKGIEPEVTRIEQDIAAGKSVSRDDINLLLLKAQYNHINHLDEKVEEMVGRMNRLELSVEQRISAMENKFAELKTEFAGLKTEFAGLKTEFANQKADMQEAITNTIKWYIGGVGVVIVALKLLDIVVK